MSTESGVDQINSGCRKAFDTTAYVVAGAGALLAAVGSIDVVIHSVRRAHARQRARDAQHRLDEFDADHALELSPHIAFAARESVFGLSLQGSF